MRARTIKLLVLVLMTVMFVIMPIMSRSEPPKPTPIAHALPTEVTIAYWGFQSPGTNENAQRMADYISENFGIVLKPHYIEKNNWEQRINLAVASDALPDVFVHGAWENRSDFLRLINSKRIRSIPKSIYEKYENLDAMLYRIRDEQLFSDGQMYNLPRTLTSEPSNSGNRHAFFYRKDYAQALGYDFTKQVSWDMLARYFGEVVTGDPDGNGKDDTIGFTLLTGGQRVMMDTLYESYGVREWMYEDGQWIPGLLSRRSKEITLWLKKLYEAGAIDRDYFGTTAKASSEKFSTGRVAVLLAPADLKSASEDFRIKYWSDINPTLNIEDYVGLMACPMDADGNCYNKPQTYDTSTLFSSAVTDQKLDKVLRLMDFLYTEEGSMLLRYGFEGEHYRIENREIVSLVTDLDGAPIRFSDTCPDYATLQNLSTWRLNCYTRYAEPTYNLWDFQMDSTLRSEYWANNSKPLWTDYLSGENIARFSIDEYANIRLAQMITTPKNYERDWQQYLDDAYANDNVRLTVEEVNAAAALLGIDPLDYGFMGAIG